MLMTRTRLQRPKRSGANLSCPKKASIARERKVQSNPALVGKRRVTHGAHGPKMSAWQRVQEHKNEHFTVVKGLLRCDACKESLSKKKSTVKKHISSSKHVQAKNDLELSKKNDKSLLHFFKNNDAKNNAKGEALPHDM